MATLLTGTDGDDQIVTVDEFLAYLVGGAWSDDFLDWPPDVFCFVAALLQKTGAYIRFVRHWPPATVSAPSQKERLVMWTKQMQDVGRDWWYYSSCTNSKDSSQKLPKNIRQWWDTICNHKATAINELERHINDDEYLDFWEALLQLGSAADEACIGIGLSEESPHTKAKAQKVPETDMLWVASVRMMAQELRDSPSTLTRKIRPSLAVVLPKLHTPQSGITLRSISHNLAFIRSSEVKARFSQAIPDIEGRAKHALNLLLVPWPLRVAPSNFESIDEFNNQRLAPGFGFFGYKPDTTDSLANLLDKLRALVRSAIKTMGYIDGVVFPELALTDESSQEIFDVLIDECEKCFLIAGVGSFGSKKKYGKNKAVFLYKIGKQTHIIEQHKHHRWQLDGSQIEQYGLGSRLDPGQLWWEHIAIEPRELSFISVADRITLSVLICEDLARQDPISDIIRTVGPNLVVALLMDGPQIASRWPARYATVFADDPGSSVLTLTSFGMAQLSRPADHPSSRIVGLWKDRFKGLRQIELAKGAEAIALSLTIEDRKELTADGRCDNGDSSYLRLSGIHQIELHPSL